MTSFAGFDEDGVRTKKVVFCIPTMTKPYQQTLDALRASIPLITEAGWEEGMVNEVGCPYISAARATMLRKALDARATVIVFIDHDVSWEPADLLRLIETEGDVVAGTYRFKMDKEKYMGEVKGAYPEVRPDPRGYDVAHPDFAGCIKMDAVPAGFLKITRNCVNVLMDKHPELIYGEKCWPILDLFNHGAHQGMWWGEDFAFCRRWQCAGGDVWCLPNLHITHHTKENAYPGNYNTFLRKRPGGDLSDKPVRPEERIAAVLAALKPKELP